MRAISYALTSTRINNAKPGDKLYKLTDGGGLFVAVLTSGKKVWRYQYVMAGKRSEVTIGRYPDIGVADARDRHSEYRAMVENGIDPSRSKRAARVAEQQAAKARVAKDTVKAFSLVWLDGKDGQEIRRLPLAATVPAGALRMARHRHHEAVRGEAR